MKKREIKKDKIIKLKWHGTVPSEKLEEFEWVVKNDINHNLKNLTNPSDLIIHTVFLDDTMEGENITVWGEQTDPNNFHCEYSDKVKWTSLN